MTDNEIIKGLKHCKDDDDCFYCPLAGTEYCVNSTSRAKAYYDLINRQKAEIEKQKELTQYILGGANALLAGFAYKVKAKFDHYGVEYTAYTIVDDVVKEMGCDPE